MKSKINCRHKQLFGDNKVLVYSGIWANISTIHDTLTKKRQNVCSVRSKYERLEQLVALRILFVSFA